MGSNPHQIKISIKSIVWKKFDANKWCPDYRKLAKFLTHICHKPVDKRKQQQQLRQQQQQQQQSKSLVAFLTGLICSAGFKNYLAASYEKNIERKTNLFRIVDTPPLPPDLVSGKNRSRALLSLKLKSELVSLLVGLWWWECF